MGIQHCGLPLLELLQIHGVIVLAPISEPPSTELTKRLGEGWADVVPIAVGARGIVVVHVHGGEGEGALAGPPHLHPCRQELKNSGAVIFCVPRDHDFSCARTNKSKSITVHE